MPPGIAATRPKHRAIAPAAGPAKSKLAMIFTGERQIRRDHSPGRGSNRHCRLRRCPGKGRGPCSTSYWQRAYSKTFLAKRLCPPKRASRIPETDLKGAEEECK